MNPERWREVLRLYDAARNQPEETRQEFLRNACADESLVQEVLQLVATRPAREFLEPPQLVDPAPGTQLGEFVLGEEIGRGGMGVVFKARQGSLQRTVAVKVLPGNLTLDQRKIDRFHREARSVARIRHPGIVPIITVGEDKGTHFIAMEFVPGRNLAEELLRLRKDLGASSEEAANLPSTHASDYCRTIADIARQVADALQCAHAAGIVHRDIKPSNLLLDPARRVRVVDFGLARDAEQGTLTESGDMAGTPHYMSPEQARAARLQIDHRTDIYSLGVVLYELLTLRRPFEGKTSAEIIGKILERDAPPIHKLNPRVPHDLATICATAMAKDPRRRYASAADLRDDLARFLEGEAIVAKDPSLLERAHRWCRRHRRALVVAATAAGALAAGIWIAGRLETQRRIGDLRARLAAVHAGPPLRTRSLNEVQAVQRELAELAELGSEAQVFAGGADDAALALEKELGDWRLELASTGNASLELAKDMSLSEGVREQHRLSALLAFQLGALLFPENEEFRRHVGIESVLPTITVSAVDGRGDDVRAEVYLREIDLASGLPGKRRRLGNAPLPRTALPSGYYRVEVVFEAGGFRELVCSPGPTRMELALRAVQRADEETLTSAMTRFADTTFTLPADLVEDHWRGQTVSLEAFYLDPTEVSNAEYAAFVRATGHVAPSLWHLVPDLDAFLAEHGDLPVTGVTWDDAVAFAEWSGKRLPTAFEWLLAAAGPEGRPFPYSADPAEPPRGNVMRPSRGKIGTEAEAWATYLANVEPVRSHPDACTPTGLFHMWGNVVEFTESVPLDPGSAAVRPRSQSRFLLGGAWFSVANQDSLRTPASYSASTISHQPHIGFRCAKSARP